MIHMMKERDKDDEDDDVDCVRNFFGLIDTHSSLLSLDDVAIVTVASGHSFSISLHCFFL